MQIVLCIASVLFGGLSLLAAAVQVKKEKKSLSAFLMAAGSLLLIAAVVCNILGLHVDFLLALFGCAAICAAAIWNGMKNDRLHPMHHVIRIALSILLLIGFILL